ncbi:MAG: HTH domain-containing protein [Promethearchaeati archaeon SRVP18_Atabeyarchaeia-1]
MENIVDMASRIFFSGIRCSVVKALYEGGPLNVDSLIQGVGFNPAYTSKFKQRYIRTLLHANFIMKSGDVFLLTPTGLSIVDMVDEAGCELALFGKVQYLYALKEPRTNEQLMKELDISRRACWEQIENLKSLGLVRTLRTTYRVRSDLRTEEIENLPAYHKRLLWLMMNNGPLSPEEISSAMSQRLNSVYSRLSELKRMNLVEHSEYLPASTNSFHIYHELTEKGRSVLRKLDQLNRLNLYIKLTTEYFKARHNGKGFNGNRANGSFVAISFDEKSVNEREVWDFIAGRLSKSDIDTFEVRKAFNLLRRSGVLSGHKYDGYTASGGAAATA